MDVVSELLNTVTVQAARWDCHEVKPPFVIRRPAGGLHFLALNDGECSVATADHAPVAFQGGQVVSLPHGNHHVIRNASAAPTDPPVSLVAVQLRAWPHRDPPSAPASPRRGAISRRSHDWLAGGHVDINDAQRVAASTRLVRNRRAIGAGDVCSTVAELLSVRKRSAIPTARSDRSAVGQGPPFDSQPPRSGLDGWVAGSRSGNVPFRVRRALHLAGGHATSALHWARSHEAGRRTPRPKRDVPHRGCHVRRVWVGCSLLQSLQAALWLRTTRLSTSGAICTRSGLTEIRANHVYLPAGVTTCSNLAWQEPLNPR